MAKKQAPSRRATPTRGTNGQKAAPSRLSGSGNQAPSRFNIQEDQLPPRYNDVIRCEKCGEDYSVTYRECPFCDSRPGRTGVNGRRVDGRPGADPIQVVGLVVSLALIISALFIVFKYVGPLIMGRNTGDGSGSSVSTSQSQPADSGSSQSGVSSSGDVSGSEVVSPTVVVSLTLSHTDFTAKHGEEVQITASVAPDGAAPVMWSSSDPDIITVDQTGKVKNINSGDKRVKTTITAACGDKTAECTVYCRPAEGSSSGESGTTSGSAVKPNSKGVISNAGRGLNVRSGPGSDYEKVASVLNGDRVTILEDVGNGWLKVDYGNGKIGYVSRDYVTVK